LRKFLKRLALGLLLLAGGESALADGSPANGPTPTDTPVTDAGDLRAILSGYTLLGYFQHEGGPPDRWTEYHCPNGQSRYIHGVEFSRGKWTIEDGHVCYTYDRPNPGEVSCFDFFRDQAGAYKLISTAFREEGFTVFISNRLAGDPFKIQKLDGGACEDLSS
jgi:hypothetical protein